MVPPHEPSGDVLLPVGLHVPKAVWQPASQSVGYQLAMWFKIGL